MDTTSTATLAPIPSDDPLRVAVIVGSTRPTRRSPAIASWVAEDATQPDLRLEVVDLADHDLPLLREPAAPMFGSYEHQGTRNWSATIAGYDAFVLVTPEYNASFPAALKNALDHLYTEWRDKPVGFVGYGMAGGIRAVEQLRQVVAELGMIGVGTALALSAHQVTDGRFVAAEGQVDGRATVMADLARLARVLRPLRADAERRGAA